MIEFATISNVTNKPRAMKRCFVMFFLLILTLVFAAMTEGSKNTIDEDNIMIASENISSEFLQTEKEISPIE